MKINQITNDEYNELNRLYVEFPALSLQNDGYQYINFEALNDVEKEAHARVAEILSKAVHGFSEFSNFRHDLEGKPEIRLQYNYNYDNNYPPFTGVGYILIDELFYGF